MKMSSITRLEVKNDDNGQLGIVGYDNLYYKEYEVLWIPINKENQFNTITLSDETLNDLIYLINNSLMDK